MTESCLTGGVASYACGIQLIVSDVMNTNVVSIDSKANVKDAANSMVQNGIGSLIVTEQGRPVGIITETDMLSRVLVIGRNVESTKVKMIMSKPLIYGSPDMDLIEAARLMVNKEVKKLPIISAGRLVGILAVTDVISVHPCMREFIEEESKGKIPKRFMKRLGKR